MVHWPPPPAGAVFGGSQREEDGRPLARPVRCPLALLEAFSMRQVPPGRTRVPGRAQLPVGHRLAPGAGGDQAGRRHGGPASADLDATTHDGRHAAVGLRGGRAAVGQHGLPTGRPEAGNRSTSAADIGRAVVSELGRAAPPLQATLAQLQRLSGPATDFLPQLPATRYQVRSRILGPADAKGRLPYPQV